MLTPNRLPALAALVLAACAADASPEEAAGQLEATIAAYRGAPGMTDRLRYTVTMPDGTEQSGAYRVTLGAGGDAAMEIDGLHAVAVDGVFYFASGETGPYISAPVEGGFVPTMMGALGGSVRIPPPPQIVMREGAGVGGALAAFGFGLVAGLEPTGMVAEAGAVELTASGPGGELVLAIDSETDLVTGFTLTAGQMRAVAELSPEVVDDAAGLVAFDGSGRVRVDSVQGVMLVGPEVGQDVSGLVFEDAEGREVALSAMAGRVVVLDFWAGWCGNCRFSLPQLQRAADWAASEELGIEFLAVNSRERADDPRAVARAWWSDLGLSLPSVFDPGDEAADSLRANSFPQLVVIGPDGRVVYAHAGFDPEGERALKRVLGGLVAGNAP